MRIRAALATAALAAAALVTGCAPAPHADPPAVVALPAVERTPSAEPPPAYEEPPPKPSAAEPAGEGSYSCAMHPQVHRAGPGTCPICGMDLVVLRD